MIDPDKFSKILNKQLKVTIGVPDSLLKYVCNSFEKRFKKNHIVSTNEGSAVSFAIGHFLSTKTPALVYMQNSGLGNAVNPLTSLAHKNVYGIPMILMIGWRGELYKNKQIHDEPQHLVQGRITLQQLKLLKIPYKILNPSEEKLDNIISDLKRKSLKIKGPVALIIRKNTFKKSNISLINNQKRYLFREKIIKLILDYIPKKAIIISTTGLASRELYELRKKNNKNLCNDFLTVGGMGHASQIASGIAFSSKKKVVCIDGDGSLLMHLGNILISSKNKNFTHILINNSVHDSVGGQTTNSNDINFSEIAMKLGYKSCKKIYKDSEIKKELKSLSSKNKSTFIEIKSRPGYRKNIGRPKESLAHRKKAFMKLF